MKRAVVFVLTLVLIFLGYQFFEQETEIRNYPPKNAKIVAFGDSLVEGVGASTGKDFVSVLSVKIGEPIVNLGKSGNTTEDGLKRLPEVIKMDAGTVLVLLGGNDYLRRIPKADTVKNLEKIIGELQSRGTLVVLLGVRGGLLKDNYEKEYRELAERAKAAYVPNVLEGILGKASLMFDQIHPNDSGYEVIAQKVFSILKGLRE
ncbi:MAG: GDSL-type esterase/lipase family protein [Patescibacteria group bacterium]